MTHFKRCSRCKKEKLISDFQYQNITLGILMTSCKSCLNARRVALRNEDIEKTRLNDKKRYQKNKEHRVKYAQEYRKRHPERTRATNWKAKYGITSEQFYKKLAEQDNKCAICERSMDTYSKKIFCVDHNHTTNKIRGILCDPCNYGLGFYEKYKDKYILYLLKFGN